MDVGLLDCLVFDDAEMIYDNLTEQPLLLIDALANLKGLTLEEHLTVEVGEDIEEHVERYFLLIPCFNHFY